MENTNTAVLEETDHRKMAFFDDGVIKCYDFSTERIREITDGFDPCISPDGLKIAYTEYHADGINNLRTIQVIDIETGEKQSLNIDGTNHFGPIWSPTGDYIAFSIMKNDWQVGLIKPDASGFQIFTTENEGGIYCPNWSPDGNFVYAHDLENLYKFNLDGELVDRIDLNDLFGGQFYFSSSTRFFFTSDNSMMVFEGEIDEYMEGLNEPLTAVFSCDLNTKVINRLTPEGLCITNLWLDKNDQIYFSGFWDMGEVRKIYQMNLSDSKLIELLPVGMYPSVGERFPFD